MKTARTIGLGVGLILLAGIGAVTFSRAQQPGEKSAPRAVNQGELRERVITLRAEVDLLQFEYDAARPDLLEALKKEGKLTMKENPFQPVVDVRDIERNLLKEWKRKVKNGQGLLDVKEVTEIISTVREKVDEETAKGLKNLLEEGKEEAFVSRVFELDFTAEGLAELDESRKKVERERQRFLQKARNLYEKKLDLIEAEKQYHSEAK